MNRTLTAAGLGFAALAVAGCAADAPEPSIPQVTLAATDYAYDMQESIPGGLVQVNFVNRGAEAHHAQIVRLNDGVTRGAFADTLAAVLADMPTQGEEAAMRLFAVATLAGGPGVIDPGKAVEVIADLAPGEYALLCFVPGPDGIPHIMKDMIEYFSVTASDQPAAEPPVADAVVELADFAFSELPALRAGRVVLEARNAGPEPHEMIVVRLDGISAGQFMEMMAGPPPSEPPPGPPPFEFVGGVQGLMTGDRGWVTLDLQPGTYALICVIPSPANHGAPHAALGMIKEFTVSE